MYIYYIYIIIYMYIYYILYIYIYIYYIWTCFFLSVRKFWLFFLKKLVFEHRNLNFTQISIKRWENIHIYGLFR